jgi:hypothetical protein
MSFCERSPLDPVTFEEISFSVGELANLGGALAIPAKEGADHSILFSGE